MERAIESKFIERCAAIAACITQSPAWSCRDNQHHKWEQFDACLAVLGASWEGATYIPLETKLSEEWVVTILELCNFTALIADAEGAKRLTKRVLSAYPPLVILPDAEQFQTENYFNCLSRR